VSRGVTTSDGGSYSGRASARDERPCKMSEHGVGVQGERHGERAAPACGPQGRGERPAEASCSDTFCLLETVPFVFSLLHCAPGFWDSDCVGQIALKFVHLGEARDSLKPAENSA
jgi:hypothetical protein